jgi:hypothetical protein
MLSADEATALIEMEKELIDNQVIQFPPPGFAIRLEARGKGNPAQFISM